MPDYRPIPGQTDAGPPSPMNFPTDDLSRMASERASSILSPYGDQFGNGQNKPIVQSPSPGAGGAGAGPVSSSVEDKLYQSIHPDTFAKVLETIMQFVTGKPIPKYQEGTDYVPKTGPAMLHRGEAVIPAEENRPIPDPLKPFGPSSRGGDAWERQQGQWRGMVDPFRHAVTTPEERETGPGANFPALGRTLGRAIIDPRHWEEHGLGEGTPSTPTSTLSNYPTEREHAGYGIPTPGSKPIPGSDPNEWRDYLPEGQPTGIRYKSAADNPLFPFGLGDEMARQSVKAEAGRAEEKYGIPIPRKSYYDVHPEERAAQDVYDMTRGPGPSSYEAGVERMKEMNLMDIVKNPNTTKEARASAGEQLTELRKGRADRQLMAEKVAGETYGRALEYGPGTPGAQEKLAHAEYLKKYPEVHMAGISLQGQIHLAGIEKEVAGHLEAAKIAAGPKSIVGKTIHDINIAAIKALELGIPFNADQQVGAALRGYHESGDITDEQFNKLPEKWKHEPWTEKSLRGHLKQNKMADKDIDAYIQRAKTAGII
jgi:hypothetical protein